MDEIVVSIELKPGVHIRVIGVPEAIKLLQEILERNIRAQAPPHHRRHSLISEDEVD
ncbi:MAG: hypothetical protein HYT48_00950 [Candidatus Vogelbacteria bacterium]|nr:hypothetical protein [Candidatus Vogelbacteria bacterium]